MEPAVQITVNGKLEPLQEGMTILDLLDRLGVDTPLVAVEQNRSIVPKAQHGETVLQDGDEVEVVTLVGGG